MLDMHDEEPADNAGDSHSTLKTRNQAAVVTYGVLLLIFVSLLGLGVPKFKDIFDSMEVRLPLLTVWFLRLSTPLGLAVVTATGALIAVAVMRTPSRLGAWTLALLPMVFFALMTSAIFLPIVKLQKALEPDQVTIAVDDAGHIQIDGMHSEIRSLDAVLESASRMRIPVEVRLTVPASEAKGVAREVLDAIQRKKLTLILKPPR